MSRSSVVETEALLEAGTMLAAAREVTSGPGAAAGVG